MREELLKIANSQVGVKEVPVNQVKYNDWYYGRHVSGAAYPWCVVFVCWCFDQIGELGKLVNRTASSSSMYRWFRDKGRLTDSPKPGDIGFVKGDTTPASHTFIVYEVNGNEITTIEGNIDDKVIKQKRNINSKNILGFGSVEYPPSGVIKYVNNVDYEGLNVRYLETDKVTGETLQMATKVKVLAEVGYKAIISDTTYVNKNYLSDTIPPYKTVKGADSEGLNVRKKPLLFSRKIATIKNGTRVKVYSVKGKWSKISPDADAWCYSSYLK